MQKFRQMLGHIPALHPAPIEVAGLTLVAAGLYQVSEPASFIFVGAALVFVAQGMERGE